MGLRKMGELPSRDELRSIISSWQPDARDKAMKLFRDRTAGGRQVWYCTPTEETVDETMPDGTVITHPMHGRWCDGEPHGALQYRHARADQWPPAGADWLVWLMKSGRGAGKTRSGSEWVRAVSSRVPAIALIGRRGIDVRATMIEGVESGLIRACENAGIGYDWAPSKKEFTFANGCIAFGYSAEEPDSLRGREHAAAWLDEPCHMPLINEVWSNLEFTMRLPGMPGGAKILCTSTPLPMKWLKELMANPLTRTVTVSTRKNLVNLDPGLAARILDRYEGTRKGRQELEGEVLEDVEGALWHEALIMRSAEMFEPGDFDRVVVAIDPAGTANRRSDLTGIVVVGTIGKYAYVLEDLSWNVADPENGKYTPRQWASTAIKAYVRWNANTILAEKNFGGDMVKTTIESEAEHMGELVHVKVATAVKSKQLRAEPIVQLYEQKKVWHVGKLPGLEEEMLTWVPGKGDSPNRVDALVWGLTELMKPNAGMAIASPVGRSLRGGGGTLRRSGGQMGMPRIPRRVS